MAERQTSLIEGFLGGLEGVVSDIISGVTSSISSRLEGIEALVSAIDDTIFDPISDRLRASELWISSRIGDIEGVVSLRLDEVESGVLAVKRDIATALEEPISFLEGVRDDIIGAVTSTIDGGLTAVESGFGEIAERLSNVAQELIATLSPAIEGIAERLSGPLSDIVGALRNPLKGWADFLEPTGAQEIKDMLVRTGMQYGLDPDAVNDVTDKILDLQPEGQPAWFLVIIGLGLFALPGIISGAMSPASEHIRQFGMRAFKPTLLQPNDVFAAIHKGLMGPEEGHQELLSQGISAERQAVMRSLTETVPSVQEAYLALLRGDIDQAAFFTIAREQNAPPRTMAIVASLSRQLLTTADYVGLWRRNLIDDDELNTSLRALGWDADQVGRVLQATESIPQISDVIRFAVRDVFSPEIVEGLRLFDDFPEDFAERAQSLGMSRENALFFWGAHWTLPSISLAFQMLHRGHIDAADIDLILRAQDVLPRFREPIKAVAYDPLTRVDVRRMFGMGVLDRDAVVRAYLDIGYSPENAELLTQFTEQLHAPEEDTEVLRTRDLTQAQLLKAYRLGVFGFEDASESLQSLGYSEAEAELLVSLEDIIRFMDDRKAILDTLIDRYKLGIVAREEVFEQAERLDLSARERLLFTTDIDRASIPTPRQPSRTDLEKWLKLGIIDEDMYIERLASLGYSPVDATNYVLALRAGAPSEDENEP